MDRIVIIGGGLTAFRAAKTLRAEGFRGSVTVVAAEPSLPYERPQLSKDMLQGKDFALLQEPAWYDEQDVQVLTGDRAVDVDLDTRSVLLSGGEKLTYDGLLLATGSVPRTLNLPGAETAATFRTVADARRLLSSFAPGKRLVTIGGGWIGLEVAASARQAGLEVTVLERSALPLGRVLGDRIGQHLLDLHRAHGVEVRTDTDAVAVDPGTVRTTSGDVAADLVLLAAGAIPDVDLARAAGLVVTDGVVTDGSFRTSVPHVWAAGDVALATHTRYGPLRVEHWDNAMRQGKAAALAMLGRDVTYDWEPYFYTDQYDFGMEYVGRSTPSDTVEIRGDLDANEFIAYWLGGEDGRTVTAGMNVGIWDVNDTLRGMIGTSVAPEDLTDLR